MLFFSVRINKSRNAVAAALYLIGTFFVSAVLVMIQEVEFFAPLFIIIYVGAIAVLFLFVIMVLRTKDAFKTDDSVGTKLIEPMLLLSSFLLFKPKAFIFSDSQQPLTLSAQDFDFIHHGVENLLNSSKLSDHASILTDYDNMYNATTFAQILFNYNAPIFLLAGLILLIALIGAIILTHTFDRPKVKDNDHLLSRSDKFLSLIKY